MALRHSSGRNKSITPSSAHTHQLLPAAAAAAGCGTFSAAVVAAPPLLLLLVAPSAADELRRCLSAPLLLPRLRLLFAAAASVKYLRIS
jgi:hypothetical protein